MGQWGYDYPKQYEVKKFEQLIKDINLFLIKFEIHFQFNHTPLTNEYNTPRRITRKV